jgi:hypothetical protein
MRRTESASSLSAKSSPFPLESLLKFRYLATTPFGSLVGAYFVWLAVHRLSKGFKPLLMVSIALLLVAIVGVFVEIPIVSDHVFWIMEANYLIIVAATGSSYLIIVTT